MARLPRTRLTAAVLTTALILAAPAAAPAADLQVVDWAGLQTAFQNAQDGDTIIFGPSPGGTITTHGDLITNAAGLTLNGNGWTLDLSSGDYYLNLRADAKA